MELYQIKYFLALCHALNFARAAENCNVSQPSLTRAIQKLEQELGGPLIRRERRLTHLTDLGELVQPILEEVLLQSALAKSTAESYLKEKKTVLRLGVMSSAGLVRLAPFLAGFGVKHGDIELSLVEGSASCLQDWLLKGNLDAAVVAYVDRPNKRLRYWRLYSERIVVVMARGHPFQGLKAVPLRELKHENLLFRTNCEMGSFFLESCRKVGFEPHIVYRSAREDWVQTMVAAGCGMTIMPEFTHSDGATLARPLVDPAVIRELSLVTVAGRRHACALQLLIRAIQTHKWTDETAAADLDRSTSDCQGEPQGHEIDRDHVPNVG